MISRSPVQFTLICTSTGGPATTVTWIRDGISVPYDSTHVLSQTVVDAVTAQYDNTLTVTKAEGGIYHCTVSNSFGAVKSPMFTGTGRHLHIIDVTLMTVLSQYFARTLFLRSLRAGFRSQKKIKPDLVGVGGVSYMWSIVDTVLSQLSQE